jgi:hypothetical protein
VASLGVSRLPGRLTTRTAARARNRRPRVEEALACGSITIQPVIRLREMLERGMRHRWLGPVLIVLFAVLLALVVLHTTADQATEAGVVCLAFLVILVTLLLPRPPEIVLRLQRARAPRAPPPTRVARNQVLTITPPLRL